MRKSKDASARCSATATRRHSCAHGSAPGPLLTCRSCWRAPTYARTAASTGGGGGGSASAAAASFALAFIPSDFLPVEACGKGLVGRERTCRARWMTVCTPLSRASWPSCCSNELTTRRPAACRHQGKKRGAALEEARIADACLVLLSLLRKALRQQWRRLDVARACLCTAGAGPEPSPRAGRWQGVRVRQALAKQPLRTVRFPLHHPIRQLLFGLQTALRTWCMLPHTSHTSMPSCSCRLPVQQAVHSSPSMLARPLPSAQPAWRRAGKAYSRAQTMPCTQQGSRVRYQGRPAGNNQARAQGAARQKAVAAGGGRRGAAGARPRTVLDFEPAITLAHTPGLLPRCVL